MTKQNATSEFRQFAWNLAAKINADKRPASAVRKNIAQAKRASAKRTSR
jgi:hypothetical protein